MNCHTCNRTGFDGTTQCATSWCWEWKNIGWWNWKNIIVWLCLVFSWGWIHSWLFFLKRSMKVTPTLNSSHDKRTNETLMCFRVWLASWTAAFSLLDWWMNGYILRCGGLQWLLFYGMCMHQMVVVSLVYGCVVPGAHGVVRPVRTLKPEWQQCDYSQYFSAVSILLLNEWTKVGMNPVIDGFFWLTLMCTWLDIFERVIEWRTFAFLLTADGT